MERYFIDERTGCLAVRDSQAIEQVEQAGEEVSNGLCSESIGVIQFWSGTNKNKKCPTCGHESFDGYHIPEQYLQEAKALCSSLNDPNKSQYHDHRQAFVDAIKFPK